jgi:ABC-2 type transport system ATP-binding protein
VLTTYKTNQGTVIIGRFDPIHQQKQVRHHLECYSRLNLDEELTAWENMYFHSVLYQVPKEERNNRIKQLLDIVDLYERKDSLVKTYSGGMRRRLEIARALLHHPKIFFMDEPTLGLDPQTRNVIWQYIHELNKKYQTTIFFHHSLFRRSRKNG